MAEVDVDGFSLPDGVQLQRLVPVDGVFDPPILALVGAALFAIAVLICVTSCLFGPPFVYRSGKFANISGRVALVVAHPDDEAMFFWPTLLQLHAVGIPISVLCLSTGNYDGLGGVRAEEMRRSCLSLGVAGPECEIVDAAELPDGPHPWPEGVVADRVTKFVASRNVATVITFDDRGISGHPNHVSTSRGVRRARANAEGDRRARDIAGDGFGGSEDPPALFDVLMLETVSLPWKYIGFMALIFSPLEDIEGSGSIAGGCACTWPLASLTALRVHRSQLVWYRFLSSLFSRYAYLNTFQQYERLGPPGVPAASIVESEPVDSLPQCDAVLRERR